MASFRFYEQPIYTYYEKLIEFNKEERYKKKNKFLISALNLNIILSVTCFIEGILEDRGKLLIGYYREVFNSIDKPIFEIRKSMNYFYNNIEDFLSNNVSKSTGLDKYVEIYKVFTGKSLKQHSGIPEIYEGIKVLFQLRNMLAHGRQIHAYEKQTHFLEDVEEVFSGGYKQAEDYLLKNGLISEKFITTENPDIFFTNTVADHFHEISLQFIEKIDEFVKDNIFIADDIKNRLDKYNINYNTDYDIYSYLRMRGSCAK